jgi:hypothetical protein
MGHGPILGSVPNVSVAGPRVTVRFSTVSVTVTVKVSWLPFTLPLKRAGSDGPTVTG